MENVPEFFIGIDLHKDQSTLAVINYQGELVKHTCLPNNPEQILKFVSSYKLTTPIGIEATRNWYWQYDMLKEKGYDVRLANPHSLRANIIKRKKTDTLDATLLAQLLRMNMFPTVYASFGYRRELSEYLRLRETIKKQRGQLKNRIHAQLVKHNLKVAVTDLFGEAGKEWLSKQIMPQFSQRVISTCLSLLDNLNKEHEAVEFDLKRITTGDLIIGHLAATVPGVGFITACWLRAAIGNIDRFPSAKKLSAYFGMVPSTFQSADNVRHGSITRWGNGTIRAVMVQSAHLAARYNSVSRKIFLRIAFRRGKKIAYVALARKLMTMVYFEYKKIYTKVCRQANL